MSNKSAESHPLVAALFWILGKDLDDQEKMGSFDEHGSSGNLATPDSLGSSGSRRSSLVWKDDLPDEKLATWHEFAEVKAPDMPLANSNQRLSSSLKSSGQQLSRRTSTERSQSDDDFNRRSPNSDQWGLFVSLTPPTEYYTSGSKEGGKSSQEKAVPGREGMLSSESDPKV